MHWLRLRYRHSKPEGRRRPSTGCGLLWPWRSRGAPSSWPGNTAAAEAAQLHRMAVPGLAAEQLACGTNSWPVPQAPHSHSLHCHTSPPGSTWIWARCRSGRHIGP